MAASVLNLPCRLKLNRLLISSVKSDDFFKDFVTFHRQNILTVFSDSEENNFYLYFILFVFDFNIKLI